MPLPRILLYGTLSLALGAQPPSLLSAQPEPVTASAPEDPAVAQALAPSSAIIQKEFGQVLVQAPLGIPRGKRGEENLLGYWVTDLMRERASRYLGRPVAFAFTNSGGLRRDLQAGAVRVSDIFEIMPFDNELVVAEFSGAELHRLLREALRRKAGEPCSGIRAHLGGRPDLPILSLAWEDGRPLAPDERVLVASTDYLLASGDGLPIQRSSGRTVPTGIQIRQLMLEACEGLGKREEPLARPTPGRYTFGPGMLEALLERRIAW